MEVEEFRRVLAAGLGRAILHLRDHDDTPYRDVILSACTHGLQYDRQLEGARSKYLLELIECTDRQEWYHDQILAALERTPIDPDLDADQLFAFAWQYAEEGDVAAREALYAAFAAHVATRSKHARESEGNVYLVELDGLKGFLIAADLLGQWLLDDPEVWFSDWALSRLEERQGKEEVAAALRQAATANPHIAAYVSHVYGEREVKPGNRADPTGWTSEQLLLRIADYANRERIPLTHSDLQRWGLRASDTDIVRAAEDLLRETEPARLYPLLSIFTGRAFPLDPDRLIMLARTASDAEYDVWNETLDERIAWAACRALQNVAHPAVRELARYFMGMRHLVERGTGLLRSNYHDGDHVLIEDCLRRAENDEVFHSSGRNALQIYKTRPLLESVGVLTLIYERDPCSRCRDWAVELLDRLHALPEWMINEGRFD
ncbi:MAG: hypothetical protein M3176_16320, partial [Chloroflexota bacterium]|nr:hypothetical protein [Chloroflexota bacterium]